jgi:hypothetical protein
MQKKSAKMYISLQLSERFSESLAAFGTVVRAIGGDKKAGTSSLKRVSVRIFRITL